MKIEAKELSELDLGMVFDTVGLHQPGIVEPLQAHVAHQAARIRELEGEVEWARDAFWKATGNVLPTYGDTEPTKGGGGG